MIVGFDYQNQEVVAEELDGLMSLKPALSQFLIYGPVPGTPFYERVIKENLLQDVYTNDKDLFYRRSDGFQTMIKHPSLSPKEIETIQRWCFEQDFSGWGQASIGYSRRSCLVTRSSKTPPIRICVVSPSSTHRNYGKSYPIFLAGRLLGPNGAIRKWIGHLERSVHGEFGRATLLQRFLSVVAVGAALWTWLTLKIDILQHPRLLRTAYRMPEKRRRAFGLSGLFRSAPAVRVALNLPD